MSRTLYSLDRRDIESASWANLLEWSGRTDYWSDKTLDAIKAELQKRAQHHGPGAQK